MANVVFGIHKDWTAWIATQLRQSKHEIAFMRLDIVDLGKFDAAVPLTLSCYDHLMSAGASAKHKCCVPTSQAVALCHDKLFFNKFLIDNGFGVYIPTLYDDGIFPYIIKPKSGDFGAGCSIVRSRQDELRLPSVGLDEFMQEYIPGDREYATHILYVGDRVLYSSTSEYLMGRSGLVRGFKHQGLRRSGTTDPKHLQVFEAILKLIGYNGTCCFNYKLRNGRLAILELNPRYGASLTADVDCYLDFYLDAIKLAG